jgi:hypothetical protein
MKSKRSAVRRAAIILTQRTHFRRPQKTGEQPQVSNNRPRSFAILASWLSAAAVVLLMTPPAKSQCPIPLYSGLQGPVSVVQSSTGDLLVSESGSLTPNTGQISIVTLGGSRRALLSGMPSGVNDIGTVSGPAGLFMRGRILYVAISAGNAAIQGETPGSIVVNPAPYSRLFSSVWALRFSRNVENTTGGFYLTSDDQEKLASKRKVKLSNGGGEEMTIELVADFPDFLPGVDPNIAHSNPFGLVAVADQLYVTDGGENKIWQIDLSTGSLKTLTRFPRVTNPLYPGLGGPKEDAVPTGITYSEGRLLLTLFRGVPFAPGTSVVVQVDPVTRRHREFMTGLTSAIDIKAVRHLGSTYYLVLQFSSVGPFLGGPGLVLRFASPDSSGAVVTDCLISPTSMALDEKTGTLYVTQLTGDIIPITVVP